VSRSINKNLRKAEILMKTGEVEQAQKLYETVLSQYPKNKKAIQGYQKLKTPPQVEVDRLISLFNSSQLQATISLGKTLSRQFPSAVILYEILGAAHLSLGLVEETIIDYRQVLQLSPKNVDAYNNLGMAFYKQGEFAEAAKNYYKAVELEPSFADAHYNLGNALKQTGDLRQAIESYRLSLTINPNDVEVLSEYGNALRDYGEFDQAIECYNKVLKLNPSLTDIQAFLDNTIEEQKEIDELFALYQREEKDELSSAQALYFKGTVLNLKNYPEAAIDSFKNALRIEPDYPEVHLNIGIILNDKQELGAAIESYKKAIKINPNYADAHYNLGIALKEIGETDAAIESYRQAIKIKPDYADANLNQSLAYLHNGNFKSGWAKHEWRWKTDKNESSALETTKPRWSSSEKNRVLLWAEQGIGDEIMFASVIPDLYAACSKLIVKIDKRLIPLFRRSFPEDIDFRLRDEAVSETEYDAHIPMGSLPLHFRQTIDSFKPTARGWLTACDIKASRLRRKLLSDGSEILIGISWHSTKPRKGGEKKVMKLAQLAKKLDAPKVKLINLQYGDVNDELDSLQKETGIEVVQVREIDNKTDIDDLAALIMACDKVVSISNVTIHLAGALGKEAQLLLASLCDWRWGQSSKSSYWYNSVRLYRQTKIDDWDNVLKQL
jgi:tetratricopeptide (TPR) repeat protein